MKTDSGSGSETGAWEASLSSARLQQLKEQIQTWGRGLGFQQLGIADSGYRFDVMQMPVNPMDYHQQSFQRAVLPALVGHRLRSRQAADHEEADRIGEELLAAVPVP